MGFLGVNGASLISCVALEEIRITVICPKHLVIILWEILPTLPKNGHLSRIVLDADRNSPFSGEVEVDRAIWSSLHAVVSEYVESISAGCPNCWLALQFRVDEEGASDEHEGWVREVVDFLVLFPWCPNHIPRRREGSHILGRFVLIRFSSLFHV